MHIITYFHCCVYTKIAVVLHGLSCENQRVSVHPLITDSPLACDYSPLPPISRNAEIRSCIGGWVEKKFEIFLRPNGLEM